MRGLVIAFVVLVGVLTGVAGGGYLWLQSAYRAPTAGTEPIVVDIPKGSGVAAIARRLVAAGAVENADVFRFGFKLFGDGRPLRAGEYRIKAGASPAEVARILIEDPPVTYRITVPEGLSSAEVVAVLMADPVLTGTVGAVPPEGSMLPETYHFHRGATRAEMVGRMRRAMDEALAELWPRRQGDLPLATPGEAVTLASIVEKETALADERPRVAAVFVNRLNKGMRLQSDPTVIYGITRGREPFERPLTRADLDAETPYNTYRISGLPPTPIANPGRASIAAVLNPLETDEFYFVADGDGGHAFARTLREHNRNVRAWRRLQRQQRQQP